MRTKTDPTWDAYREWLAANPEAAALPMAERLAVYAEEEKAASRDVRLHRREREAKKAIRDFAPLFVDSVLGDFRDLGMTRAAIALRRAYYFPDAKIATVYRHVSDVLTAHGYFGANAGAPKKSWTRDPDGVAQVPVALRRRQLQEIGS